MDVALDLAQAGGLDVLPLSGTVDQLVKLFSAARREETCCTVTKLITSVARSVPLKPEEGRTRIIGRISKQEHSGGSLIIKSVVANSLRPSQGRSTWKFALGASPTTNGVVLSIETDSTAMRATAMRPPRPTWVQR